MNKKPKCLYRYYSMELIKHIVTSECMVTISMLKGTQYPDGTYQRHGDVYRCIGEKYGDHDFHGFATLKEAKEEAIENIKKEIMEREQWLKKKGA